MSKSCLRKFFNARYTKIDPQMDFPAIKVLEIEPPSLDFLGVSDLLGCFVAVWIVHAGIIGGFIISVVAK